MRFLVFVLCLSTLLTAQQAAPGVHDLAGMVQASRLSRCVDRLASFGTRHTLSDALSDRRGIAVARTWLEGELQGLTRLPGSRLVVFEDPFRADPGPLLPTGADLVNLGVILPGVDPGRDKEALVVVAHYDSRARDIMDAASEAPGAVDNASGVALVLEMARVLAADTPAVTIYFVATAGGVQGQLGSARMVKQLKAEGVEVIGMAAADCVGNSLGSDGSKSGGSSVRLFSDSVPAVESEGERRVRELLGTENDGVSRELARYLKRSGERYVDDLECQVMLRRGRLNRDGEHTVFTRAGFPGVEVAEQIDPFDRLAQKPGTPQGRTVSDSAGFFDSGYCARITRMLVAGFHQLACAPAGPQNVGLGGIGTADARLWWTLPTDPRVAGVVIYRRRADGVQWQQIRAFPKCESQIIPGVGTDTEIFAVATVDAQGNESLPVAPRSITY